MSAEGLSALRERVHADSGLALRLRGVEAERFAGAVLQVASEIGCEVTDADVAGAMDEGQRGWILRRWDR